MQVASLSHKPSQFPFAYREELCPPGRQDLCDQAPCAVRLAELSPVPSSPLACTSSITSSVHLSISLHLTCPSRPLLCDRL